MRKKSAAKTGSTGPQSLKDNSWIEQEAQGCQFQDVRLAKRFIKLLEMISGGVGKTIPAACQDWANTKAAYRFLSNERVSEDQILAGHFEATAVRMALAQGPFLILHDTTEFTYERADPDALGFLSQVAVGKTKDGRPRLHTVRGILMHSSMALTLEGLPLGLAAVKFWTRKRFKGCEALKHKINPTRVPIEEKESYRWLENMRQSTALAAHPWDCVHIGDRESDIYELFCVAHALETFFLVRTCVDRLAAAGDTTIAREMKDVPVQGTYRVQSRGQDGKTYEAVLEIKFHTLDVRPPIGKQAQYPELKLAVIHAVEKSAPQGREKIQWKLLTNMAVPTLESAIQKLNWYALRWKIETFHKILKSGCKAEESKLRTSERLVNLLALFCILSWRIFWMTMVARTEGDQPATVAVTETEIYLLDRLVKSKPGQLAQTKTLSEAINKLARLGGYLARAGDSPPGNLVMWRGLSRLNDIQLGFTLGNHFVGN